MDLRNPTNIPDAVLARGDVPTPPLGQLVVRIFRHVALAALAISLTLHLFGIAVTRYVHVGGMGGSSGGDAQESGPIGMAVVSQAELSAMQDAALGADAPAVPDYVSKDPLPGIAEDPSPGGAPGDAPGGDALGDIGSLAGAGDVSLGNGSGLGGGGSGSGGTSFFGVEARGNRFAYLVDVSGSMGQDNRIGQLRGELDRSVKAMLETSSFLIIAYSDDAQPLGNVKDWREASPAGKRAIHRDIEVLNAGGGTNPLPGFQIIFSVKPRPDAIYFMTDGDFDDSIATAILDMDKTMKVPIHCICLGNQDGEKRMRMIARQTNGTYKFVPTQ